MGTIGYFPSKKSKRKRKVLQIQEMTPESDSNRHCCAELGDAFCYAFFPMMMKDWPSSVWGRGGPSSSWCTACTDPTSITLWVTNCSINKWVEAVETSGHTCAVVSCICCSFLWCVVYWVVSWVFAAHERVFCRCASLSCRTLSSLSHRTTDSWKDKQIMNFT